jgi:hypothetical protein
MPRTVALLALSAALLAACGSVKDRRDCRASPDCPAGESCVATSEGRVCWPDAVPPAVTAVATGCPAAGCVRDGALPVTATAGDDVELLAVEASLDLDPSRRFPLARQPDGSWAGSVPLAALPFPHFSKAVAVTVHARDGARNEAALEVAVADRPMVTRVRWQYAAGGQLTPAAIDANGRAVFGRSDTSNQVVAVNPDGTKAWSFSIGAGTVTAAPSIGAQAIWVGANDGKLYAVALDGSAELTARSCAASGTAKGPPAVLTTSGVDVAFGAFSSTQLVASSSSTCAFSPIRDAYSAGAAVDADGNVVGVTVKTGAATIRRFSWAGSAFEELWASGVGGTSVATPAFDANGQIISVSQDAGVDRTALTGSTSPLATLAASIDDSPIVLSSGDVVVGDASGRLHRIAPDGSAVWTDPPQLGAALHAPIALADGPVRFLVASADGKVHALDDAGALLWEGPLNAGMALGAANLYAPAGGAFATAYFGGADGKLHAVVVEGRLDTAAPWPKAWHDARNTSRAGGTF